MYQALLTRRYLTSKVMPLLAAIAVALCTAMVLIVWSVMGGFLNMLLGQGSAIIGDVSIANPVVGFPYYDELIDELEARPEIEAATPTIESLGLLGLSSGEPRVVQVIGVRPEDYNRVTGFVDNLWWRPVEGTFDRDDPEADVRTNEQNTARLERAMEEGSLLEKIDPETGVRGPALVTGIEVSRFNQRTASGIYVPRRGFVPNDRYTLGVLPLSRRGVAVQVEYRALPVANEYRSGMYDADSRWVFVPFELLQRMLKLDPAMRVTDDFVPGQVTIGPDGVPQIALPKAEEETPGRATHILIRGVEGTTPRQIEAICEEVYRAFAADRPEMPLFVGWERDLVYIWEEKPGLRNFIAAVRKETGLVLVLFVFISFTAVFLVAAIFWSIVSEKTKDIGVLRAVGASRFGVAWLFVRYGMAIGLTGSAVGGLLAYVIVTNINPIHDWLGRTFGFAIWDPTVYYFTDVPARFDPQKAAIVLAGGVVFSMLGALVPATRAAVMDPVRALRFE